MPNAIKIFSTGGPEVLSWERHDQVWPRRNVRLIHEESVSILLMFITACIPCRLCRLFPDSRELASSICSAQE